MSKRISKKWAGSYQAPSYSLLLAKPSVSKFHTKFMDERDSTSFKPLVASFRFQYTFISLLIIV